MRTSRQRPGRRAGAGRRAGRIALGGIGAGLLAASTAAAGTPEAAPEVAVDHLWVLVCAALIFFMQSGFLLLEAGLVRPQNALVTALKNIADWTVVSVLWVVFGFGLAFGATLGGMAGTSLWLGAGVEPPTGNGLGWVYVLFQLGFAGTAVTIVSGAMAERVSFLTYVLSSVVNGGVVYPVVAHWIWGGSFLRQDTFLGAMGFVDFAGSTAVHCVGGWFGLVGIWALGPRIGRFDADGRPRPLPAFNPPMAALGVFVLWVGWFGFNGGSTLLSGSPSALVIINTNLAGAVAALTAWVHGRLAPPRRDVAARFMGGALTGLVAITACASVVTPAGAIVVGLLAGLVHNVVFTQLLRWRLDDPVGAVPVHLAGGILGTMCVGLLGRQELLPLPRHAQIGVQLFGLLAVGAFCILASTLLFGVLRRTVGLRVAPGDELSGLTLDPPESASRTEHEPLDEAELRRLLGGPAE